MNAASRVELNSITRAIIQAAYRVSNELGCGFLEKVYENALALELRWTGHRVTQQHGVDVRYRKEIVGRYIVDLLIDDCVVIELKAMTSLDPIHRAQCLNYLRATGLRVGLLLNFGRPKLEIHRVVCLF
jgi:GxxExxY protein